MTGFPRCALTAAMGSNDGCVRAERRDTIGAAPRCATQAPASRESPGASDTPLSTRSSFEGSAVGGLAIGRPVTGFSASPTADDVTNLGFATNCSDKDMVIVTTETPSGSNATYTITVGDIRGSKTYTVTPNSLSGS